MVPWMILALACAPSGAASGGDATPAPVPTAGPGQQVAVLAGGCFWCLESDLDHLPGVIHTTSGYAGGATERPSYAQVGSGSTGHTEAVHVVFDPAKLSYAQLLDYFWRHVDPTDAGGQFCDRGSQYRTGIFPVDAAQAAVAMASKEALSRAGALPAPIVTEITTDARFWSAEVYHQDFHRLSPEHYQRYRAGCGRDARVKALWGASASVHP